MSQIVPESSVEDSNTKTELSSTKKQVSPAKYWCFTLNNYTDDDISSIINISNQKQIDYIFGEEVGDQGTPHLQGFIRFKSKNRPMKIFSNERVHWEKTKSSFENNCAYCMKQDKYHTNIKLPKPVKLIDSEQFYEWQKNILKMIEQEPDDRDIYWYVGKQGCGKTQFIKYLVMKHNAILLSGKCADMKNGIIEYMKSNNNSTPELICCNLALEVNMNTVSYRGFEDIKDMCFYSGKYEGGMVCGNNPHLLIFANNPPASDNKKFIVVNI